MTTNHKLVSIVAPFFNEENGVSPFHEAISRVIETLPDYYFEIICVDDGSNDNTLNKLIALTDQNDRYKIISLSRNFGKESALSAGIDASTGDAVIPIDADLQDPPELIPHMIEKWEKGSSVVLAKRVDRSSDAYIKRKTAELFYRFHNKISDLKIPENVGDYRLMDRTVINAIKNLHERQRFMKGIFSWVGFETETITYKRDPRIAGKTKFSAWKLWNFALEGITSFSTIPLKVWSYIGSFGALTTFLYLLFIIFRTIILGVDVPGYASLLVAILFFGSLQLVGIGILGEYLGRVYMETKQRPNYIIKKTYHSPSQKHDQ